MKTRRAAQYGRRLLAGAFLLISFLTQAQVKKVVVSGYVRDAETGEPLQQAVVFLEDKKTGVATDAVGFYSFSVTTGEHTILCSYFGYVTEEVAMTVTKQVRLDFDLKTDQSELEAATIFSRSKREEIRLPQMGLERVDAAVIKKMPTLLGEADVIRVIQMMPGVQTPSEGSTGFSVRGGGLDQNLVLIDGAPVYNSGHFLGFLSMFNGDVIRGVDLYKGDFPASYGGRLSSVLDISTKDGNNRSFGGNFSIGLITSKLFLEGPILPGKLSFMLAGRRTYMDLFFPLFGKRIPDKTQMYFYDLNAKLSWIIGEKDRLYLSAFSGKDVFGLSMEEFNLDEMVFGFANHTQTLRWNHVYSPKITSDVILYNSLFQNDISTWMESFDFDMQQQIREFGVKAGWTWYLNHFNTIKAGVQTTWYGVFPGAVKPRSESSLMDEVTFSTTHAFQPAIYLQNEQKLGDFTLRYGVRFASFITYGPTQQRYFDPDTHELTEIKDIHRGEIIKTFSGFEPRVSVSYSATDDLSFKAAWMRSFQYLQQARVSITGSPVDAWFTASPNLKPQRSDQYSLGVNALFLNQALTLSLEGFYKDNRNTVDFIDKPGSVIADLDREGKLRTGKSWAYGVEAMLKYEFARWSGWLAYTWSRSRYKIPEINNGKPYPSPLNHEHAINFVLSYDFTKQWSASAEWVYYSGAPTTYPIGRYYFSGSWIPVYSSRNEDRLPDYHRMDLSLTFRTPRRVADKRWSSEWNLSLYNAYSRHNAWSIGFNYNWEKEKAEARKVYLFTIVPSISCNIKF
jgi:outer membrane receptor protein involved in Fe transport